MDFILNNWVEIICLICLLITFVGYIITFISLPTNKKKELIKKLALSWVTEAENKFGGKTGKVKLTYAYEKFISKFPFLVKWISIEKFNELISDSLKEMEETLKNKEGK